MKYPLPFFSSGILAFILVSFLFNGTAAGQAPNLNFRYLNSRNGLTSDDVRCIFQDKEGFMWFGTEGGIDRYDGKNFQNYFSLIRDTTNNLLQNIRGVCDDSFGGIWFVNDTNGLVLMNRMNESVKRFRVDRKNPRSLSSNNIRNIFEDSRKNFWITTMDGGLNLFNRKDSSFIHFLHDSTDQTSIGSNRISCIAEDHNGMIWLTSPDGLLIRLDPVTRKFENIKITSTSLFFWTSINMPSLYIDEDNTVWYADNRDLYSYNQKNRKIILHALSTSSKDFQQFTFITSIFELEKSLFLIATFNSGLFLYNAKTGKSIHYSLNPANPFGIGSNHLTDIYRSHDGVIWIGSSENGINIYSKNSLRFPQLVNIVNSNYLQFSNHSTYSFCELPDKRILMGTENNGILEYNPEDNSVREFLNELGNYSVFDIGRDTQGYLWICAWINGLYRYDLKSNALRKIKSMPGLPSTFLQNVVRYYEDSKNRHWMGTMGQGLGMNDGKKNLWQVYANDVADSTSLNDNIIYKITEDSKGNIWIGTGKGLAVYDPEHNSFRRIKLEDRDGKGFGNITILDIFEDHEKRLWIGSGMTLHLYVPQTGTFRSYVQKIKNDYVAVNRIFEDENHRLWLGTNAGIYSFDPELESFTNYGITDGTYFLKHNPSAGLKASDGKIYFGNARGVTVFNPEDIADDTLIPPVFITSIRVNDVELTMHAKNPLIRQPVMYTGYIKLNHKQSTLAFSFASLNYSNPDANQYAYQLEGYDRDWVKAGNSNTAYYAYLPPGKYVFKVIASNSHGYWNSSGKQIIVIIKPPVWRTLWFRILAVLVVISAILLFYLNHIKSLRQHKIILEGIVSSRTRELNEANTVLTEQHEELVQQHEEITSQNEMLSQMSQEILKQNAELEQHRSHLEKLVVERTHELEVAVKKAEESDRLKSAFLANMSHEIRTPMNAIVGFANLLKDNDLEPEEKNEFIDVINANSEILLVLIDDILDLSLIEANQLTIRKEVFSVNEILDHLSSSYSLMNKKDNLDIRLNNELHGMNIRINSDRIRIRQILSNLLNNAYKFTEKGFIELGLRRNGDFLSFYVQDTGIGISKKEIDRIFERFRKSDAKTNTFYRGTGLGLAISKALAHLLDGNLSVESTLGKGSVFYFQIPWSQATMETPLVTQEIMNPITQNMKGKDIMIVEDEQANYLYAKKMLSKINVNVHWAENGLEAINMISAGMNFHLILMDIKMPVMDGFEATKAIKAKNPDQIVIALTAYARPEDRIRFMKAGFDDYLAKPIRPNDFIGVIRKYF